jgi:RNA polymerase sigma factor (TIGR02999 family)
MTSQVRVTSLLADWSKGRVSARDELMPLVYDELRKLARHHMAMERDGHSLQATALVNEAYLRLVDQSRVQLQARAHFFALASQMMRHILVDHARGKRRQKRGGSAQRVSLDVAMTVSNQKSPDLLALDEALLRLGEIDSRKCQVVEMRYFGGLSFDDIAEVLGLSRATVERDWTSAKTWLYRSIAATGKGSSNDG